MVIRGQNFSPTAYQLQERYGLRAQSETVVQRGLPGTIEEPSADPHIEVETVVADDAGTVFETEVTAQGDLDS